MSGGKPHHGKGAQDIDALLSSGSVLDLLHAVPACGVLQGTQGDVDSGVALPDGLLRLVAVVRLAVELRGGKAPEDLYASDLDCGVSAALPGVAHARQGFGEETRIDQMMV